MLSEDSLSYLKVGACVKRHLLLPLSPLSVVGFLKCLISAIDFGWNPIRGVMSTPHILRETFSLRMFLLYGQRIFQGNVTLRALILAGVI